jgi:hypothetical protein
MQMTADLAFDLPTCHFGLSNWSMQMGDLPTGGTVAADQVTMTGSNYWQSCVGTLVGGNQITGTCSQDGADFQLGKQ